MEQNTADRVLTGIIRSIVNDASLRVDLKGSFKTDEQTNIYEGILYVGENEFNLSMTNFNTGFPTLQTLRDIKGIGISPNLLDYMSDPEKAIGLTVGDEYVEINRANQLEAQLLMLIGRMITDNTP